MSEDKDKENIKNNVLQFPNRMAGQLDKGQDSWKLDDLWDFTPNGKSSGDEFVDGEDVSQQEKFENFVNALVDELSIGFIKTLVDAGIDINEEYFYKDLAFVCEMFRGLCIRNFGQKHISQRVMDKLVSLQKDLEGKIQPVIDYAPILNEYDYKILNPHQLVFDFYKYDIEIQFQPDMEWPEDDQ